MSERRQLAGKRFADSGRCAGDKCGVHSNVAPSGATVNSPAIYRWEKVAKGTLSPAGTKESVKHPLLVSVPDGTRCSLLTPLPSDKSLGYFQSSLRDEKPFWRCRTISPIPEDAPVMSVVFIAWRAESQNFETL